MKHNLLGAKVQTMFLIFSTNSITATEPVNQDLQVINLIT